MGMTGTRGADHAQKRAHPWLWGGAAALLALPGVAMLAGVEGVDWSPGDFVVMGGMLAAACALCELGLRLGRDALYRAGFALAVLTGFLTVWVNLAVGMLGDEGDAPNLMFGGVLLVAGLGALLARFRARGMAWAMAAAAAQLLAVGVAAAMGGFRAIELGATAGFALPWLLAAALFAAAGRARSDG